MTSLFLLLLWFSVHLTFSKTTSGVFNSQSTIREKGHYITSFCFHSGNGTVLYKFNVTADASFYLFLDEDWQEALDHDNCQSKLGLARLIYNLTDSEGNFTVSPFTKPRRWHIIMADRLTCGSEETESQSIISYEIQTLNPDSLHNPTDHCSCEELGLLRFFQLLTLVYFLSGCICAPKIWEALRKQGPMHVLLIILNLVTLTQGIAALFTTLILRNYTIDGETSPWLEFFTLVLDQFAQYLALVLLLSLSIGRDMAGASLDLISHYHKLSDKPTLKIIQFLAILQIIFILTNLFSQRDLQFPLDPGLPNLCLLAARAMLAIAMATRLQKFVQGERSVLKRHFYSGFNRNCLMWFLCYPLFHLVSFIFSPYFRPKFILLSVESIECLACLLQYRLLISRSLYWEVSSLSSYLPLRMDKSFGAKLYS
ncbi:hypothetical protein CAPTEDRAFT_229043 [Capitella teleta]|uniref:Uncharacterized protein n=1 Tax=Capitella teleta TaxID=283909 RepID=R7UNI8_CAPTE|nr:hypothetical protein CAPTEDRAFT_229043 [Capitella teleta]|eukprot:ELU05502.1 hypothetical protein CAPTEDRAFT_229043 [Capitella teleta]